MKNAEEMKAAMKGYELTEDMMKEVPACGSDLFEPKMPQDDTQYEFRIYTRDDGKFI